jgi:antitoxin HicB
MDRYLAIIQEANNSFTAIVPDFWPGILVDADTKQEAELLLTQALAIYLHELGHPVTPTLQKLTDVPPERLVIFSDPQVIWVIPAPMNPLSLMIATVIEQSGLSQREIALKMGTRPSVIIRLADPFYWGHSLDILKRLSQALGADLQVYLHFPSSNKSMTTSTVL